MGLPGALIREIASRKLSRMTLEGAPQLKFGKTSVSGTGVAGDAFAKGDSHRSRAIENSVLPLWTFHPHALALFSRRQEFDASLSQRLFATIPIVG